MTHRIETGALMASVVELAHRAGREILAVYERPAFAVQSKPDDSPLTEADEASQEVIVRGLQELTPGVPVLSEEASDIPFDVRREWDTFWLVDPLDGTKEFIKRNDEFTVNIALVSGGNPVLGVVYAPVLDTAWAGIVA